MRRTDKGLAPRWRRGTRPTEATKEEILRKMEFPKELVESLLDGDVVVLVKTPDGIARRVIKGVRNSAFSAVEAPGLTVAEKEYLEGSGLSTQEPALGDDAVLAGEIEYSRLVEDSLTTAEVADALRVSESRIRQRLTIEPRTLLGIRTGRGWLVPRYQFQERKRGLDLIAGLEDVIPRIDPEHHPVTIHRWLRAPNPDLERESGKVLSPLEWLRSGFTASVVAELAAEL